MIEENDFIIKQTDELIISACPVLMNDEYLTNQKNLWGYYLCIENLSKNKIRLVGKNWNITDEKGNSFCDNSVGFKGEIPELEPGECFEWTDTTPINANNAVFYGSCKVYSEGQSFDVPMPTFCLSNSGPTNRNVLCH